MLGYYNETNSTRAVYLVANKGWTLLQGRSFVSIGAGGQSLFPTREDLMEALALRGMEINDVDIVFDNR